MAPNCPVPLLWVGSRSTATRVTRGAISLSSSSHFPLMQQEETGGVAARPRQAFDKTSADRIDEVGEHELLGGGPGRRPARAVGRIDHQHTDIGPQRFGPLHSRFLLS